VWCGMDGLVRCGAVWDGMGGLGWTETEWSSHPHPTRSLPCTPPELAASCEVVAFALGGLTDMPALRNFSSKRAGPCRAPLPSALPLLPAAAAGWAIPLFLLPTCCSAKPCEVETSMWRSGRVSAL